MNLHIKAITIFPQTHIHHHLLMILAHIAGEFRFSTGQGSIQLFSCIHERTQRNYPRLLSGLMLIRPLTIFLIPSYDFLFVTANIN